MSSDAYPYAAPWPARLRASARRRSGLLARVGARTARRPELLPLLGLTGALNLWGLSINGWANTYYSAAVRSMSTSWHDFLFASLDKSGLMTVDKPPLSLWTQALSVRVFGFHPLSLLVPQALMGVATVGLVYDLVARRFGRPAGFVAGLALATTPVAVAVSRHNNPDELLVLCCVAAVWCALRALDTGRTRWLVLSGVAVGLGFETKMGVALMVVPGIAAGWMWMRGRRGVRGALIAFRQLLAGGAAMVVVGGAWPALVALTPAADRPWISGTSDNNIFSLILGYNGLGRLSGQSGGPQAFGGGGTMFGGPTGPFRLLQSGLGDQAGWLLGFALVAGIGLLVATRLVRRDPRSGWLIMIGGSLLSIGFAFSFAGGIFHPYYVSLLAPFTAALVGAGAGQMLAGGRAARIVGPLAIGGGALTELVVLGELNGALGWAVPLVVVLAAACAALLMLELGARKRAVVVAVAIAALMAAPATWAAETLGHATNGTFPTGGPASASMMGGPGAAAGRFAGGPGGPPPGPAGPPAGATGRPPGPGGGFGPPGGGGPGGFGADSSSLRAAIRYASAHGGGTVGVASQSSAATAIVSSDASVAGLGGFSGRESSVTVAWLASKISSGHLRWVIADQGTNGGAPGDTRTGSSSAMSAVAKVCRAVSVSSATSATSSATGVASSVTMYDCLGRAGPLLRASSAAS